MSLIPRSSYQPVVRVGNWFEDICLEQDKLRIFTDLRDRGDLLVEKTRRLFVNFHKEITLEAPKETICFGAIVQLLPYKMKICQKDTSDVHAALSVVINEHVVRHSQTINEGCELTISPSVRPCVRNSFRIVGSDKKDSKELLKYGQHFRLECAEANDDPLWLYSAQKSADLNSMITPHKFSVHHEPIRSTSALEGFYSKLSRNIEKHGALSILPSKSKPQKDRDKNIYQLTQQLDKGVLSLSDFFTFIINKDNRIVDGADILKENCEEKGPESENEEGEIHLSQTTEVLKCVICVTEPRNVLLIPCRHFKICSNCFHNLEIKNCGPGKQIPTAYTNWYCQHVDPKQRFETDGTPLPSNHPLVVTHAATNRNLAAENAVIQTLFGPVSLKAKS